MRRRRVVILGAAGRDFHDFNVRYRDDAATEVVAFTAAQIPNIEGRRYPPALAGPLYPEGIPVHAEDDLPDLVRRLAVDEVVLAYSDLSHEDVMHKASLVLSCGATFTLLGAKETMIRATKPVVSVTAVRTGAGKSPTSRFISRRLRDKGFRVAVVRHPMPYGDLERQAAQRFATLADMDEAQCTIEEREEYEPHVRDGAVVFAGVDYARVLEAAAREADVILWDGGNNDFPFVVPDLDVVVADPHRAGHETRYHPGETNFLRAGVLVVSKVDTANEDAVKAVERRAHELNPRAAVVHAGLKLVIPDRRSLKGRRALVVEDGPTVTHGGMRFGAGTLAARELGAEIVDAASWAVGSIADTYLRYPHLRSILPAMGYGREQIEELEATINASECDLVIDGTPADLARLLRITKPVLAVEYEYDDRDGALGRIVDEFAKGARG